MGNQKSTSPKTQPIPVENKQLHQDSVVTISILLDESGSMGTTKSFTMESLNSFILKQKRLPLTSAAETKVSLTKFNTVVSSVFENVPLHNVPVITDKDYNPDGGTALFDAIGNIIGSVKHRGTDPVIVVILTDGEENSSKEFSSSKIRELVKTMEEKGWTFVYLGANQDSFKNAQNIGISSAQNFEQTQVGIEKMMDQVGENMSSYRKAVKSSNSKPIFTLNKNLQS